MPDDPGEVARASYRAYVDKDRDAIEALIAPDFHFTSPLDNRLDRDAYLARCWREQRAARRFPVRRRRRARRVRVRRL